MHGNFLLVDYSDFGNTLGNVQQLYVGSATFDDQSLTQNRELGFLLNQQSLFNNFSYVFNDDYADSAPYVP